MSHRRRSKKKSPTTLDELVKLATTFPVGRDGRPVLPVTREMAAALGYEVREPKP